jgi:hypothetical protein
MTMIAHMLTLLRRHRQAPLLALILSCALIQRADSHAGPPFPILEDQLLGSYSVSVWVDPDIGIGTFYVVLQAAGDAGFADVSSVQIGIAPTSGRLPEKMYAATPMRVREGARYFAQASFDRQDMWQVRVDIDGRGGRGGLRMEVETTPDGTIGPIGLLIYALPFVAVAVLWLKALLRQRSNQQGGRRYASG